MSHSKKIRVIGDNELIFKGIKFNIHDITSIILNNDSTINNIIFKSSVETKQLIDSLLKNEKPTCELVPCENLDCIVCNNSEISHVVLNPKEDEEIIETEPEVTGLNPYRAGQLLKDGGGYRKILFILGSTVCVSDLNQYEAYGGIWTYQEIQEFEWTMATEAEMAITPKNWKEYRDKNVWGLLGGNKRLGKLIEYSSKYRNYVILTPDGESYHYPQVQIER